jgi:hypothetical protein
MAITVSFTTTQVVGAPQNIVITDTSTGSDVTAVTRRIYLQTATDTYLVPDGNPSDTYILWPIADGSVITLDVLDADAALDVTLMYVNVSGTSVAEDTLLRGFTLYNETFYYSLTQAQALQNQPPPMIIQDSNYYSNKMILRTEIDSGNQAIAYGADIVSAQNCYSRATYMVENQNLFF